MQSTLQALTVQGLAALFLVATLALAPSAWMSAQARVLAVATLVLALGLGGLARWALRRPHGGGSWVQRNIALAALPGVVVVLLAAVGAVNWMF